MVTEIMGSRKQGTPTATTRDLKLHTRAQALTRAKFEIPGDQQKELISWPSENVITLTKLKTYVDETIDDSLRVWGLLLGEFAMLCHGRVQAGGTGLAYPGAGDSHSSY